MNTNWYIASLLSAGTTTASTQISAQRCQYLIQAGNHDEAYRKALEIGNRSNTKVKEFLGILDLLMVHDEPVDGAELLWSESEIGAAETEALILPRGDIRAFREGQYISGWYICSLVLCEVHDEGSHGNSLLVWTNSYLIRAPSVESAYEKAMRIGSKQQGEASSHRCDGERAHWEFRGIHDIVPAAEVPAPDALLWCDDLSATDGLRDMIPKKSELAVFKWEAEQAR